MNFEIGDYVKLKYRYDTKSKPFYVNNRNNIYKINYYRLPNHLFKIEV